MFAELQQSSQSAARVPEVNVRSACAPTDVTCGWREFDEERDLNEIWRGDRFMYIAKASVQSLLARLNVWAPEFWKQINFLFVNTLVAKSAYVVSPYTVPNCHFIIILQFLICLYIDWRLTKHIHKIKISTKYLIAIAHFQTYTGRRRFVISVIDILDNFVDTIQIKARIIAHAEKS